MTYINDLRSVIRSRDGGRTWHKFRDQAYHTIGEIAVGRSHPLLLIATVGYAGVYRWDASASGWNEANSGFGGVPHQQIQAAGPYVYSVFDFAYRKQGQSNWVNLNLSGFLKLTDASYLTVNPQNPSQVFLQKYQLYRSDDAGDSWNLVSKKGYRIVGFDPNDANIFYVVEEDDDTRVHKSRIDNFTPEPLPPVFQYGAGEILINPFNPQLVFFQTSGAMYRSDDGGNTVRQFEIRGKRVYTVIFHGMNNGYLALTPHGVFKTADGGKSYTKLRTKFRITWLYSCDPQGKQILAQSRNDLYRSLDLGQTWQKITSDFNFVPGYLTCLPSGELYVATDNGIYKEIQTGNP